LTLDPGAGVLACRMQSRLFACFIGLFTLLSFSLVAEEKRISHADVARQVMQTYEKMTSYQAGFNISTSDNGTVRAMSGQNYYKAPGKIRFEFDNPAGNLIVSDGKTMWVYIRRLNAAGRQDLRIQKKDESGKNIFQDTAGPGVSRLFRKYHYRFDGADQPRKEDGVNVFVLLMDQREKTGGYQQIKLSIDAESYLIRKAVANDGQGKVTTLTFRGGQINPQLEGKLFQYEPTETVRVVANPLVSE
jgi:outer membrane lipoprotein carrier protein